MDLFCWRHCWHSHDATGTADISTVVTTSLGYMTSQTTGTNVTCAVRRSPPSPSSARWCTWSFRRHSGPGPSCRAGLFGSRTAESTWGPRAGGRSDRTREPAQEQSKRWKFCSSDLLWNLTTTIIRAASHSYQWMNKRWLCPFCRQNCVLLNAWGDCSMNLTGQLSLQSKL